MLCIRLDLAADARDADVNAPVQRRQVALAHQLLPRQYLVRALHEFAQHLRFGRAQQMRFTVGSGQRVGGAVQRPAQKRGVTPCAWGLVTPRHRRAPQNAAHTRHQFARFKGLDHVVIAAHFQPHDPVKGVAAPCQHQHTAQPVLADLGDQAHPVHVGQAQVQDAQVGPLDLQFAQHRCAVAEPLHREVELAQRTHHHAGDVLVVFHQVNQVSRGGVVRGVGHGARVRGLGEYGPTALS